MNMDGHIKFNLPQFMSDLRVDHHLCSFLEQSNHLSSGNVKDIMAKPEGQERNAEFLKIVRSRGVGAILSFKNALEKTSQQSLADLLKTPMCGNVTNNPGAGISAAGNPVDGPDDMKEDEPPPPTRNDLEVWRCFPKIIPNNVIKVPPGCGKMRRTQNAKDCYTITNSKNKGVAVLINIYNVKGHRTRIGSEHDMDNLTKLFTQQCFNVKPYKDLSSAEMKTMLLGHAQDGGLDECDVFVLCVMSHGKKGKVLGSDGLEVDIQEDIITPFHSKKCTGLFGKPKIVLIQACQGSQTHGPYIDGLQSPGHETGACTDEPDVQDESVTLENSGKFSMNADTDMLVVCSTCSGYVSYRESIGSWFIRAFVMEMQNYCHEKHMIEIITKVIDSVCRCRAHAITEEMNPIPVQRPFQASTLRKDLYLLVPQE